VRAKCAPRTREKIDRRDARERFPAAGSRGKLRTERLDGSTLGRFLWRFPGDKARSSRSPSAGRLNLFTQRGKTTRSRLRAVRPFPASAFELANQFNRAVGRSKKIIGAGWLFKIRRPRIVSGSQPYRDRDRACVCTSRVPSLSYETAMIYKEMSDETSADDDVLIHEILIYKMFRVTSSSTSDNVLLSSQITPTARLVKSSACNAAKSQCNAEISHR